MHASIGAPSSHTGCRHTNVAAWRPFGVAAPPAKQQQQGARHRRRSTAAPAIRKSSQQQPQQQNTPVVSSAPAAAPQQQQDSAAAPPPPPPPPPQQSSSSRPTSWGPVLVDGLVVQPAYRSTPWEAEAKRAAAAQDKAVVMFVSESGICRGPLAAAAFAQLVQHSPLSQWVQVDMRATRDYCQGQQPDAAAAAAADTLGFSLTPPSAASPTATAAAAADAQYSAAGGVRVFHPSDDIVAADLVLVMDKYTAADVLREVSAYDLINPGGRYCSRVRLLGSYHPQLASRTQTPDGQDIDDALYGNEGGGEQQEAALAAAKLIVESCRNLLQHLEDLAYGSGLIAGSNGSSSSSSSGSSAIGDDGSGAAAAAAGGGGGESATGGGAAFKAVLAAHVQEEGVMDWLVPPMLQGSNVDVDGWI